MKKPQMVGARELKTRLGTYMRRVKAGETLVVSERGQPIAEIRPVPKPVDEVEARLQRLAAEGFLTLATRRKLTPFKPLKIKGPSLTQTLLEDREDRF